MDKYRIILYMLVYGIGTTTALLNQSEINNECVPRGNDVIKISIFSRKNRTGQLYAQVKLEEGLDNKSAWQVDIDHESACNFGSNGQFRSAAPASPRYEKSNTPAPWYELVPGFGYYKFHNRGKTWFEAKFICEKESAHLAIVNSPEEADVLVELFSRVPKIHEDYNFIGMTDIEQEGSWVTIFNEPLNSTGFTEWNKNEPNSGIKQNCGGFQEGKLHDLTCTDTLGFFCEREF